MKYIINPNFTCFVSLNFHKIFFLMWTIFNVFSEFVTNIVSVLCFGFLAKRHVGS